MSSEILHLFNFILSEVEFCEGRDRNRYQLCDFIITEFEYSQGFPAFFNVEGFKIFDIVVFGIETDEVRQCGD